MAPCVPGDPAKGGVQSLGVPGGEPRSVSLIGGPDFECECHGLALRYGWKAAARPALLGAATLLKFEDLRVCLIGLVFF